MRDMFLRMGCFKEKTVKMKILPFVRKEVICLAQSCRMNLQQRCCVLQRSVIGDAQDVVLSIHLLKVLRVRYPADERLLTMSSHFHRLLLCRRWNLEAKTCHLITATKNPRMTMTRELKIQPSRQIARPMNQPSRPTMIYQIISSAHLSDTSSHN